MTKMCVIYNLQGFDPDVSTVTVMQRPMSPLLSIVSSDHRLVTMDAGTLLILRLPSALITRGPPPGDFCHKSFTGCCVGRSSRSVVGLPFWVFVVGFVPVRPQQPPMDGTYFSLHKTVCVCSWCVCSVSGTVE